MEQLQLQPMDYQTERDADLSKKERITDDNRNGKVQGGNARFGLFERQG